MICPLAMVCFVVKQNAKGQSYYTTQRCTLANQQKNKKIAENHREKDAAKLEDMVTAKSMSAFTNGAVLLLKSLHQQRIL